MNNSSTRLALLLALQLAGGATFIACGGGGDDTPAAAPTGTTPGAATGATTPAGGGSLALTYSPMYSAFVEGHEAKLPVMLKDASLRTKGATFTSSDTSVAVVTNTETGGMITVKKDGTTNIIATLGSDTGSAKLTVTKFTEAQWQAGKARYSKSDLALISTDGKPLSALALANPNGRNANGACNTCHTAQAKTLKIENGPTQIGGYSDDELVTIFTMGKKPDTAQMKSQIPLFVWGMFHTWTVTDEEKPGLIAYLRTQTPTDNPAMIDYGVKPCPGSSATLSASTKLCDNEGNPVMIPGYTGGGTTTPAGDAGTTTTAPSGGDAGTTTSTPTTSDAGAAHDAG